MQKRTIYFNKVTTTKTGHPLHEINLAIEVIKAPERNAEHLEQLVR